MARIAQGSTPREYEDAIVVPKSPKQQILRPPSRAFYALSHLSRIQAVLWAYDNSRTTLHAHIVLSQLIITIFLRYPKVPKQQILTSVMLVFLSLATRRAARPYRLEKATPPLPTHSRTCLGRLGSIQRSSPSLSTSWILGTSTKLGYILQCLNVNDQDSLNSDAVRGVVTFFGTKAADCSSIIESKSKVRSLEQSIVLSSTSRQAGHLQVQLPLPVKAIVQSCVTCVGAHNYRYCPDTNLHFELSFADALLHMPKFAPMFRKLLNNTDKILDLTKTPVNENCSAVILKTFPEKLGGPGDFILEEIEAELSDTSYKSGIDDAECDPEKDILLLEAILNSEPLSPLPNHANYFPGVRKELKICEAKTDETSIDEPPEVELKDLPPHLEYAFLEGDNKSYQSSMAKDLSVPGEKPLLKVVLAVPQASHRLETLRYQGY
ncbi:hypothetical protein Tco_0412048 [Tanacetum coccineum]